jgi:hypothetical protein
MTAQPKYEKIHFLPFPMPQSELHPALSLVE